jgi:hypothetical protein
MKLHLEVCGSALKCALIKGDVGYRKGNNNAENGTGYSIEKTVGRRISGRTYQINHGTSLGLVGQRVVDDGLWVCRWYCHGGMYGVRDECHVYEPYTSPQSSTDAAMLC